MAEFNPTPKVDGGRSYLGDSKGIDAPRPNRSFETLFEGIGGVVNSGVKAIDSGIKQDIQDQVYAGVDKIRGEVGVDVATDKARGGNSLLPTQEGTPVPSAVTKAQEDVARLKEAYDQGKINDSYYWGRVNALSKQIRTQYPTYREEIDQAFSGVTGSNPANALRKAIQADFEAGQNKLSQAQSKEDAFVNQNLEFVTRAFPDYFEKKNSGQPYSFDAVRAGVATFQTKNAIMKEESTRLELLDKQGKLDTDTAQSSATTRTVSVVNDAIAASLNTMGARVQEALKSGKPLAPEELQQLKAAYGQLRAKAEVSINQTLNTPFGEDKTRTFASVIKDSSKLDSIKKNALSNLDSMFELLSNGQYGLFSMNASMAKAMQDYDQAKILSSSDAARKINAAQAIAGQATNALFMRKPQLLDEFSDAMGKVALSENLIGEGSLTRQLDSIKSPKTGKLGRGAAASLIDNNVEILKSPDTPPQAKVNVVKSMFGDTEGNFLEKFSHGDRVKVFQRMTAPEVTQEMIKLRTTDPKAWGDYKNWVQKSFGVIIKTQADGLSDLVANRPDVQLKFDPATMQYSAEMLQMSPGSDTGGLSMGLATLNEKSRSDSIKMALDPVNAALRNIKPILDDEKDPEGLAKIITGIDPSRPKQQRFLEWLSNGIIEGVKSAISPNKAKADTPKANPKFDPQVLAEYTPEETAGAVADASFSEGADLDLVSLEGGSSSVSGGIKGLLDTISQGESGGSYNKIYGGREVPLTSMTIGQVMSLQNTMVQKGSPSSALGKYQFINKTLGSIAKKLGMGPETPFNEETQDRLALGLLEGRGLNRYLRGEISREQFLNNIAKEWAAVPQANGRGAYDGDGLNRAKKNVKQMLDAIEGLRA